ncbi:GNAT family N-acetyltransferase [Mesoterricola silvestris]|uniref:N-acetyltransferase domain-containing protein n=1 Tax=Mesoterricola silvestris TaxID=2927979 RepID=A0AA48GWR9_9BACT|nr:GNAT family N-acetyltransferase [Mesoterricola silvestris]BDU71758.1 hypothetical protein METEAL_09320 [Mesoterricola silvestris]
MSDPQSLQHRTRSLGRRLGDVLRRIPPFLGDLVRKLRTLGFRAATAYLWSRVTELTENLLYEFRTTGPGPESVLPEGWTVRTFTSADDPDLDLLIRAGGGEGLSNFRRQAVAHVLCIEGEPVACGWQYPWDPVARWLGPDAVYLGGAWVRPEWRGRGINAVLLAHVTGNLPVGSRVVMLVAVENRSSQACLAKGASTCRGLLQVRMVLSMVWKIRLLPIPEGVVPSRRGAGGNAVATEP